MRKEKSKWAADDDTLWAVALNDFWEAKRDTVGNIGISFAAADRGSLAIIMGANSGAGSDILPFSGLLVVDVVSVTWLYGSGVLGEYTSSGETSTDTGAEGKIKSQTSMER